jgi:hypothetical protein
MEDTKPIMTLCENLTQLMEEALQPDLGWVWQDMDTAQDLCDVLTDLLRWKRSAEKIARSVQPPGDDFDPAALEFFSNLETEERFLVGTVRWHFEQSLTALHDLETVYTSTELKRE